MTTLIDFLTARLDEDEAAALATTEHQPIDEWDAVGAGDHNDIAKCNWQVVGIASPGSHTPSNMAIMQHIARHDPARVLREVAAKRAIVELADEASGWDMQVDNDRRVGPRDTEAEPYVGDLILRHLAAAYPDCPEEWKP